MIPSDECRYLSKADLFINQFIIVCRVIGQLKPASKQPVASGSRQHVPPPRIGMRFPSVYVIYSTQIGATV